MGRVDAPILRSLLDIDFYKFTMGQLVFHKYSDVRVEYAFLNRRPAARPLAEAVPEGRLREELDHARTLRFNNSELHYLRGTNEYGERMFKEDYLGFLAGFSLPDYALSRAGDGYDLRFEGPWSAAIYWETIALSIVHEIYCESLLAERSRFERDVVYAEGRMRLTEKVRRLRERPGVTFVDFGTRRRFSREWQDYLNGVLAEELPDQSVGTSNTELALKHGVVPMGTSAHEMYMVMAGIHDKDVRASHNLTLRDWWDEYGWGLSIALTDNYGTDFFFRDFTPKQAREWKGLRQDSGDPFEFGEKAVRFYERLGIDPREKMIVFSDGLDVEKIIRLYDAFAGRIRVTFGWGTDLTNDLGIEPLSIIVKAVRANGRGLVKLTDDPAKAIGEPRDIERYRRIFGNGRKR